VASSGLDAREARRANPEWNVHRSLGAAGRLVRATVGHVEDGQGDLAELAALVEHEALVAEVIDQVALTLLARGASYREIAAALKISRSRVEQRYPGASSRRPGGQPAGLR
jgi:hypothetical protein